MSPAKPLVVFWSKAAVDAANSCIDALHDKLKTEASGIILQTRSYFVHVFASGGNNRCFIGTGHEQPDAWKIFVQLGEHTSMKPLPNDHPDPNARGKVYKMPKAVDGAENRLFAKFNGSDK